MSPAAIAQSSPREIALSGAWTARCVGAIEAQLAAMRLATMQPLVADGSRIEALDTAGAWLLHRLLQSLRDQGNTISLRGMQAGNAELFEEVQKHALEHRDTPLRSVDQGLLERVGRSTVSVLGQSLALLGFVGEATMAFLGSLAHPSRIRWRPILYNIRTAGVDALPIVALLSFLLGVVVAYQAAEQLRRFGANIFVADLVGISMLREFAPLITAIIIAGRSGSAFAAQIGTMAVTEEIDAMRTLGIPPMEMLVLPKVIALMIAMPLLTVFADVLGVFGGMIMASTQLGVGFEDFLDRLVKAVDITTFLVGVGKAPVFAAIITVVGCFQGMRTKGGADSVGRQTTRSVVQGIFLVIVADALFSIVFSIVGL